MTYLRSTWILSKGNRDFIWIAKTKGYNKSKKPRLYEIMSTEVWIHEYKGGDGCSGHLSSEHTKCSAKILYSEHFCLINNARFTEVECIELKCIDFLFRIYDPNMNCSEHTISQYKDCGQVNTGAVQEN